ncbi:MAG: hypothetical protein R6U65_06300 [Perlabentimonas sp.]
MKTKNIVYTIKEFMVGIAAKKYMLSLLLALIWSVTLAQAPLASKKQIGMFLNSTTCVVLENGVNFYNGYIKEAVEDHWETTPFEFIDQAEFEKRRFDSKYSFLVLMKNVYEKDPGGVSYNYMSLVLGGDSKDLTDMPEICSVPLYYTDDSNLDYSYAIPAIVMFTQIHAKNLEKRRFFISLRGLRYYNSSGFNDKQLLMNIDDMAPDAYSVDKINSVYPHFVKLLTTKEIQDEISANPNNALFHFHVGPNQNKGVGKCFEMIFDVKGNLYYYSSRRITNEDKDGFTMKDFKRIR